MARTTGDTKTSPLILTLYIVNLSNFCLPYIYMNLTCICNVCKLELLSGLLSAWFRKEK